MTTIELNSLDFALALALIGAAIALSLWQRLGLVSEIVLATVRATLQLLAVGLILDAVFAVNQPWLVLGIVGMMVAIATSATRHRIAKKRWRLMPIVGGALLASVVLTLSYALLVIVQPPVWYDPQYLIPLVGIVLGNAMNAATIAGERLVSTLRRSTLEIQTHLSLGAMPSQAIAGYRREAMRAGLLPLLNRMMVVGLVTLPEMFTGQVLGGNNPLNATSYQLLILFMVAFAEGVAVIIVTQGIARQAFNRQSQLVER
ncbi:MAG: iron export ABC transporter permease subunit FetB [Cyanobacteria bacterium P01_G01_bin.54]